MPSPGEDIQSWSTTAANNGTADPQINWAEGQTRASVNNSSRSELAAHAKHRDLNNGSIVTTGSANAQTFLSGVSYTSMPPRFTATLKVGGGLTNTGAMTINMDGIGDIQVKTEKGLDLTGGELVANQYVDLLYDGTNWIYLFSVLNNVTLTGNSTAETPSDPLDNDTSIATTEWVQALISGGQGIVLAQKVYNSPGTFSWTPSPGMKACLVECVGAGGGGGGVFNNTTSAWYAGGGGGSGGYSRSLLTATTAGASQFVTVGAGGGGSGPVAGNGGDTAFGSLVFAYGGGGGQAGNAGWGYAGPGAAPGTGQFAIGGGSGGWGFLNVAGPSSGTVCGTGGNGYFGGGGRAGYAADGSIGNAPGAGGGGSGVNYVAAFNGGTGANGCVIVTEFAGSGLPGPTGPAGPQGLPGGTFADAPSNGLLYGRNNAAWANAQPLDGDLTSLAAATAINSIFYRSAADTWGPITIGSGLTFSAGTLAAPSGGTITIGSTVLSGGTSGNHVYNNGGVFGEKTPTQVTADINVFTSALKGAAPASGGGTTTYLRADGTWQTPAGAGNVSNSGTPAANQWAQWTSATQIQGVATASMPFVQKAGDTMAGALALPADPTLPLQAATKQYVDALSPTTGDMKLTLKTTADTGWVMMNDGSIGDGSSSATTRANADTQALFTLLWTNIPDFWCPVSGGRGASAAADFAAHKRLTLPRVLGRALVSAGGGAGLTARVLGSYYGEEAHLQTIAEMPSHNHPGSTTNAQYITGAVTSASGADYGAQNNSAIITIAAQGGGAAFNVMQPSSFLNVMVKL